MIAVSGSICFLFGDTFEKRTGMLLVGLVCGIVHAIDKWTDKQE
jgi:hypothetical protein